MSSEPAAVEVKILDKEFMIACPPEEKAGLIEAADYLSSKMREIRSSGKVIGTDRIAIMAALNITHEMLQNRSIDNPNNEKTLERIQKISQQIDLFMDEVE
ncbi:MAG: cell division protein ZapA [Gammaproteobacteria bacterium]|nr:MAG: cell division protein ZapA [Gammaproteobacteria bacterium]